MCVTTLTVGWNAPLNDQFAPTLPGRPGTKKGLDNLDDPGRAPLYILPDHNLLLKRGEIYTAV